MRLSECCGVSYDEDIGRCPECGENCGFDKVTTITVNDEDIDLLDVNNVMKLIESEQVDESLLIKEYNRVNSRLVFSKDSEDAKLYKVFKEKHNKFMARMQERSPLNTDDVEVRGNIR